MPCINCDEVGICQNRCVQPKQAELYRRCETPVAFENVTDGYYAVCPQHDEDLYHTEVKTVAV